jgi:hypothetical protein
MLAEDPTARPTIGEVAKRIASHDDQHVPSIPPPVTEMIRPPARQVRLRGPLFAAACAAPVLYFFLAAHHAEPQAATQVPVAARVVEPPRVVESPVAIEPMPSVVAVEPAPAPPPKPVAKPERDDAAQLWHQYQRVGHDFMTLDRRFGAPDDLAERFHTIDIEAATSPEARKETADALRELDTEIRQALAEQCEAAPDAC